MDSWIYVFTKHLNVMVAHQLSKTKVWNGNEGGGTENYDGANLPLTLESTAKCFTAGPQNWPEPKMMSNTIKLNHRLFEHLNQAVF